tara:strand:- start:43 stop:573 length:531 start_codon:yes stop_codon:yes gene_type:complete
MITNFKESFNLYARDIYWNNADYQKKFISNLSSALSQYGNAKDCHEQYLNWRKNTVGYNGIGKTGGINSGLQSTAAINLKSGKYTMDHLVGVVKVGTTFEELLNEGNSPDWIVENCLYDCLYMWGTIKVSKEEHKQDNINRNIHLLEDKMNFKHYKNVSEIVVNEDFLTSLRKRLA